MLDENKKPRRRSPTKLGPVTRREMTKLRDEIGSIRDSVRGGIHNADHIFDRLNALYITVDQMDLRFRMHKDGEKKNRSSE
jgi:hypothetical protein